MKLLLIKDTRAKAERWAKSFTYARACNGLAPLEVRPVGAEFGIYDPTPGAPAQPYVNPDGPPAGEQLEIT